MNITVGLLLKQACEKIDRVRETAGNILASVASSSTLQFDHKDYINQIIRDELQL
jgi:hypothetical protein